MLRDSQRGEGGKHAGGRPTDFREEFLALGYNYALLGATDRMLAEFFGVAESTIHLWKLAHPEFSESLKRGKAQADARVADSLFQRALGYSHPAVKIFHTEAGVVEHPYTEHYAPDTGAACFWLKNRQPDLWRDKQVVEHAGEIGDGKAVEEMSVEEIEARLEKLAKVPKDPKTQRPE